MLTAIFVHEAALQVTRTYGADVWRLTAIEVVFSVAMMLGGAFIFGTLPQEAKLSYHGL